MKSHTDRKGWIYERHNKCDRVAGEIVFDDDLDQQRFVRWNWDYILVGGGKRIEGDYVNTDSRGGVLDQRWRDSKGCLVRTEQK